MPKERNQSLALDRERGLLEATSAELPPLRLPTCINLDVFVKKKIGLRKTYVVRIVVIWSIKLSNSTWRSS